MRIMNHNFNFTILEYIHTSNEFLFYLSLSSTINYDTKVFTMNNTINEHIL